MITVYTSNKTIEFAEVKFNKCTLIDYNGNEHIILDYFGKKSLYKLHHDDTGRIEISYFDEINKIDVEKEGRRTLYIRGF
jgi:hypothetical protein